MNMFLRNALLGATFWLLFGHLFNSNSNNFIEVNKGYRPKYTNLTQTVYNRIVNVILI